MKNRILSIFFVFILIFASVPVFAGTVSATADKSYNDILSMYHASISCNWSNLDGEGFNVTGDPDDACYMLPQYYKSATLREVGYALIDINNDGQQELFISTFDIAQSGGFYDMYTISDGEVLHIINAGERDRYNLAEGYSINNEGSGGADLSSSISYRLDGTQAKLRVNQAVIYDGWIDSENPWFFADADFIDENTYSYNFNVLKSISSDRATALLNNFPENIPLELTSFADYDPSENIGTELVLYSDYPSLRVRKDNFITIGAELYIDGEKTNDVSKINFQIEDNSIINVSSSSTVNGCQYITFKALSKGTTTVTFNDSNTNSTTKVNITVYDDNYLTYTLSSVPTQYIEKYPTNFYNFSGMYIDSFEYTLNDDLSANVSFDVYNSNYSYAFVEVYDEKGNIKNASVIEKMTSSNTSIKESLWDNTGFLLRDLFQGDFLTYRQESGFSKKTSINVTIPMNGYIKITNDPETSLLTGFCNSVDILFSLSKLTTDFKNIDFSGMDFTKKLTFKMISEKTYIELMKDGSNFQKELWKNIGKEILFTPESIGNFTSTVSKNIDELNLGVLITETALDFGINIGENVLTFFSGTAGAAMNILFTLGKVQNVYIQQNDLIKSTGSGAIYIQNQSGGSRYCQQIEVESDDDFSSDTSLKAFSVSLDSELLEKIKAFDPKIYETLTNGINHTYNISLSKNGSKTQPDGKVTVYIPIPDDLKDFVYTGAALNSNFVEKIKIYRIEDDDTLTEMNTKIIDGYLVFETDHFSLYTVVGYNFVNPVFQKNIIIPLTVGISASVVILTIAVICSVRKKKHRND